ncbi:hypothetical protein [Ectobacillus panaciterrae]|uniref:hypothetical protein n=1 Tax=Ectobacillus panaciterrae TaxID=363872 RepID=UPI0003F62D67|nr:hypothetical protein [Ectobacillus panaciterrae]
MQWKFIITSLGMTILAVSGISSVSAAEPAVSAQQKSSLIKNETLQQLEAQEKQLHQQLHRQRETNRKLWIEKSDLTKEEKTKLEALHTDMQKLREKAQALHQEMKAAKQQKDEAKTADLKKQLASLRDEMKTKHKEMRKSVKPLKIKRDESNPIMKNKRQTHHELHKLYRQKRELRQSVKEENMAQLIELEKQIIEKQRQLLEQAKQLEQQLK